MQSLRPFLLLVALLAFGCGPAYPEPSAPSLLASSSYSGSASSSSVSSGPSIPQRSDGHGNIIVRPDLACVAFVLQLETSDPKGRLDLLEKAAVVVGKRFAAATGGASTSKMLGASVTAFSQGKAKGDGPPPRFVVTVDGAIETPLAADAGYWARAKLVAALVHASHTATPLLPSAGEGQPEIEVAFGSPEIKLKDPEAFRPELVKRWVERARAFSRVAESQTVPLHLVSCEPPAAITQTPISVEQIGLSLPVSCRIDAARPAP
jgi:hypothetical protein